MKKLLYVILILILISSLAACNSQAPRNSSGIAETSLGLSPKPDLSIEGVKIANASSAGELHTLLEKYYKDKNYTMAMMAAKKILEFDPADDDVYAMKAELQILMIEDAYNSLNDMIEQDIGKVKDQAGYKEQITHIYEDVDLQLRIPFISDYTSADEINTVGNTSSNLAGGIWMPNFSAWRGGLFASQGKWFYYADYNDNFALYKMRVNGQDKQRICEEGVYNLNIIGDWIYFSNTNENDALYKIRTDGSMKTRLSDDRCEYICVSGNWIYYCNANEDGKIYRIKIDGSDREPFGEQAESIFVDGDWLYYSSQDEKECSRVSLNGKEKQIIIKQRNNIAQIYNGWLYYLTDIKGLVIMKMKPDGTEQTEVWRYDAKINFFTVSGNRLIACIRSGNNVESILAYDMESMKQIFKIDNSSTEAIYTDGGSNVYLTDCLDNNVWCKIDWDSGKAVKIE